MRISSDSDIYKIIDLSYRGNTQGNGLNVGKKRIGWIDLAKAAAFVLVVCGHTFPVGGRFRAIIYSFHMPLYFVLAGYTFSPKPMRKNVSIYSKRLLLPYALCFIGATSIPAFFIKAQENRIEVLENLLLRLLFATGNGNGIDSAGGIWTLAVLFVSRIILTAYLVQFERKNVGLPTQGLICASAAFAGYYLGGPLNIRLPLGFDVGLVGAFFMWSGFALRYTAAIEKSDSTLMLLIPVSFWALEIWTSLPDWNQPLSMLGRIYRFFPLSICGAVSASFLLMKLCFSLERAVESHSGPAFELPQMVLSFCKYLGQNGMKLYLIHCLDFVHAWTSIDLPLFGYPALTATIARIVFDVLILLLFELI